MLVVETFACRVYLGDLIAHGAGDQAGERPWLCKWMQVEVAELAAGDDDGLFPNSGDVGRS